MDQSRDGGAGLLFLGFWMKFDSVVNSTFSVFSGVHLFLFGEILRMCPLLFFFQSSHRGSLIPSL